MSICLVEPYLAKHEKEREFDALLKEFLLFKKEFMNTGIFRYMLP